METINDLLKIMAALRDPDTGCPWDLQQNFHTIAPYTLEEAYEVADAIERGAYDELCEELGDLLLQVVFHARMAEEQSLFDFSDVVEAINDKLVRRHPHVFSRARTLTAQAQSRDWEARKAEERMQKPASGGRLDGIAGNLPALVRAIKLQKRASQVGFDWQEFAPVVGKVHEELDELADEVNAEADNKRLADELGDVLFAVANLARKLDIDPEQALRGTNRKFEQRFGFIERTLAQRGKRPEDSTLEEMDAIWEQAKAMDRGAGSHD